MLRRATALKGRLDMADFGAALKERETSPSHPYGKLRRATAFSLEIEGFIPEFFGKRDSIYSDGLN